MDHTICSDLLIDLPSFLLFCIPLQWQLPSGGNNKTAKPVLVKTICSDFYLIDLPSFLLFCIPLQWQLPSGGNYKTAKPVPVKTTGVIGAGTMGGGIALSLITSGFSCVLVEQNKEVTLQQQAFRFFSRLVGRSDP